MTGKEYPRSRANVQGSVNRMEPSGRVPKGSGMRNSGDQLKEWGHFVRIFNCENPSDLYYSKY